MQKKQRKLFYQVVNAIIFCSIIITMVVGIIILNNSMYNVTEEAKEKFSYLVDNYASHIDIRILSSEARISEISNFISATINIEQYNKDTEYTEYENNFIHKALKTSAINKEYVYDYFILISKDGNNSLITSEGVFLDNQDSDITKTLSDNEQSISKRELWLDFHKSDGLFYYIEPFFVDGEFYGYIGGRFRPNSFLWGQTDNQNLYYSDTLLIDSSYNEIVLNHNLPGKLFTLTPELVSFTKSESNGVTEIINTEDKKVIAAFSHLSNSWLMVVAMDKNYILQRSLELIDMLIMLIIIGGIFSIFIASSVSERIVTPIDKIVELVGKIGSGDLSVSIPSEFLNYENEIGTLAVSIEVMRTSLKDYINKIENHTQHLEAQVSFRTTELTAANSQLNDVITEMKKKDLELTESHNKLLATLSSLKETQEELVESKKIAALTSLVRGVSHKLNTPVGTSITSLSYLTQELSAFFKNVNSTCDNSESFHKEMYELVDIATMTMNSLIKAREILDTLRDITSDSTTENQHHFNFSRMLEELLSAFRHKKEYQNYDIILESEENVWLYSYPSIFTQIFTNLVSNSIIHGFRDRSQGTITVSVHTKENFLFVDYYDDGIGLKDEDINNIFDPFYTTNLGNTTSGLGLSVIYNQINHKLNGSIICDSKYQDGLRFHIKVPIS